MIKNIIFDFGDIFINLDKKAPQRELQKLGVPGVSDQLFAVAHQYEKGLMKLSEEMYFCVQSRIVFRITYILA